MTNIFLILAMCLIMIQACTNSKQSEKWWALEGEMPA